MKTAYNRSFASKISKLMVTSAIVLTPALALAHPATPEARIHTSSVHEHGAQIHVIHASTIVHRS